MQESEVAAAVLGCVGGTDNVSANSLCMTRLRLTVRDPALVDREVLGAIDGVLGVATRGPNGIEVVFGPKAVRGVFRAFTALTGIASDFDPDEGVRQHRSSLHVHITPGRHASYEAQARAQEARRSAGPAQAAPVASTLSAAATGSIADVADLAALLGDGPQEAEAAPAPSARLLVLNGPNVNLLVERVPDGRDYHALVALCKAAAREAGFATCRCLQTNHEGDMIDKLQTAASAYEAVVVNLGAYAYTSLAIPEAIRLSGIPAAEVILADPTSPEATRRASLATDSCLLSVSGTGVSCYRDAIVQLAARLGL